MAQEGDEILDATTFVLGAMLATLDTLGVIARRMHPPLLPTLVEQIGDHDATLAQAVQQFRDVAWSESLTGFRDQVVLAGDLALRACEGLRGSIGSANPMIGSYRAMRHFARAQEALYPLASILPTVSQYFLEHSYRNDANLLARLGAPTADSGVMHHENETGQRGGFSIYVPEYNDAQTPAPLIVALHGGAGHGRLFLWSWVREARSRGAILIAPTASGDTWSLMDPEVDIGHLSRTVEMVGGRWALDPARMLLTGMSDGGTFTLLAGLDSDSPFTHLAPVAASFHPLLLTMTEPERIRGLPILLTHGVLDWMFPISVGRGAAHALTAAGAAVKFREIADLSHAYPRDENGVIMDWFLGGDRPGA